LFGVLIVIEELGGKAGDVVFEFGVIFESERFPGGGFGVAFN
jgi:hypothetical protein